MSMRLRAGLMALMSIALFFGFFHLFVPSDIPYSFERLHVFLFNLCSGGTVILYFTEGRDRLSPRVLGFCLLAIVYALLAFFKIYIPAIVVSLVLAGIVEMIRIERFSLFPVDFFRKVPVSEKFHQASLLCLSMGLIISSMVILNNEYLELIQLKKLQLDVFFLGFSFPVSLITMSVMFGLMKNQDENELHVDTDALKDLCFWVVTLGVITFFGLILAEKLFPQLIVTFILFADVTIMFFLFMRLGLRVQQKNFLTSGIIFLVFTAITGIVYIILEFFPAYYTPQASKLLLKLHVFVSLYGWNLSGLAVICRYKDFPIHLHSDYVIGLHWLTVFALAPLGVYFRAFSVLAVLSYTVLLYIIFSSRPKRVAGCRLRVTGFFN